MKEKELYTQKMVLCTTCRYTCPRCGKQHSGQLMLSALLAIAITGSVLYWVAPTFGFNIGWWTAAGIALLCYEVASWVSR